MTSIRSFSQKLEDTENEYHPRKEEFSCIQEKIQRMDEEGGYNAVGGCNHPPVESVYRTVTEAVSKALYAKEQVEKTESSYQEPFKKNDYVSQYKMGEKPYTKAHFEETKKQIEKIIGASEHDAEKSSTKQNEENEISNHEGRKTSVPDTESMKLAKEECSFSKDNKYDKEKDKKLFWKAGVSGTPT